MDIKQTFDSDDCAVWLCVNFLLDIVSFSRFLCCLRKV